MNPTCFSCFVLAVAGLAEPASSFRPVQAVQAVGPQDEVQETAPDYQTASFMRAKLMGSQQVLDGLVSEDYHLIRLGAESMKKMSEAVQWPQADDQVYQHYGKEFRRHCDKLMDSADANDLETAHHIFLQMTTKCIDCHRYVRASFRVEHPEDPQGPIRLIPTDWEGQTFRKKRSTDENSKTPRRQ
jgi:hypothetical protein